MPPEAPQVPALDPIQLVLGASGVVLVVLSLLAVASVVVWLVWFLKTAQLGRLRSARRPGLVGVASGAARVVPLRPGLVKDRVSLGLGLGDDSGRVGLVLDQDLARFSERGDDLARLFQLHARLFAALLGLSLGAAQLHLRLGPRLSDESLRFGARLDKQLAGFGLGIGQSALAQRLRFALCLLLEPIDLDHGSSRGRAGRLGTPAPW